MFAPGGDSKVRAFDTETGKVLWTAPVGGAIRGGPSMYEMDGRQYFLVVRPPATSRPAGVTPGAAPATSLPAGYIAFALPAK